MKAILLIGLYLFSSSMIADATNQTFPTKGQALSDHLAQQAQVKQAISITPYPLIYGYHRYQEAQKQSDKPIENIKIGEPLPITDQIFTTSP